LGGSYFIETLTSDIAKKAMSYIDEVEAHGGMTKAVIACIPKRRIEESATKKQSKIDSGEYKIVGVNAHVLKDEKEDVDVREIDHSFVMKKQVERLRDIKKKRDNHLVDL
jgi:methylmalonyl-CoA mutase